MIKITRLGAAIALAISAGVASAVPPKSLITHNQTDVESNAFVAGTIPSQHPSKANADNRVMWASVRMACYGHVVNNKCSALIKMRTNTPNPVNLGTVSIDLNTGDIQPKFLQANGYRMIVNGPAETTIQVAK